MSGPRPVRPYNSGSQPRATRKGRPLPRRTKTCPLCGATFLGVAHALFCSPNCRLVAFRLRKRAERRHLERRIVGLVLEDRYEEAERLVEEAQPPSLRPGLRQFLRREVRARQRWLETVANMDFGRALERGLLFPRRRPRIPQD